MSDSLDLQAPPANLDVPAARQADGVYRSAVARGAGHQQAWEEAVMVFAGYHPGWPLPLVEREALRLVGARLAADHQPAAGKPAKRLPLNLLVDLATPETPETMRAALRVESLGKGATALFRDAWRVPPEMRPTTARLPLRRFSAVRTVPAASVTS